MTISFATFFTKAGKAFFAGNTINTALATTIHDEVEDFVQEFGSTDIEISQCVDGVASALTSFQAGGSSFSSTALAAPLEEYLVQLVRADNPQLDQSISTALAELIRQMQDNAASLDASTPSITPSYDAGNAGDGVVVTTVQRGDGKVNEHILAEDIQCQASDATSFNCSGEEAATDPLAVHWPLGSGAAASLVSYQGSAGSYVSNGTFETGQTSQDDMPDDWIVSVGTIGTTIKLTDVEVQTVTISGTPTGGWYTLSFTDALGKVQMTEPIGYDADAATVQSALRSLAALGSVSVSTAGVSPDYVHSVTFTAVPAPAQLTSSVTMLTGGAPAIAHATTVAAPAYVLRGARTLELDSDGAELTTIQVPVSLQGATNYAACLFACVDVVPAAGVVTVDLVDGIGGAVVADDQAVANSYTFTGVGLTTSFVAQTAVFRTPTTLPTNVYFRIRITTAVSNTTSVFLDDAQLVPMSQLYTGGPFATIFSGVLPWQVKDRITLAVANDRAGALHEWMNRVFSLRESDLLLPSNNAGAETIADTLIA